MLQSKLIGETYKEWPNEATLKSHGLLIKGGYIRQVGAGLYTLLPLAKKVEEKIRNIIREEMNLIDAQEILMPLVGTKKLWDMSGRYDSIGNEMVRFKDRSKADMVLSMTHEEPVVLMAMSEAQSYQKYPFSVYQIQTKFRDEARSRGGLIRTREFTMKDAYSFHTTKESLEETYKTYFDAYHRIFKKAGVPEVIAVKSDSGMMGGDVAHEYMLLCDAGEDKIITCESCDYSANMEIATYGNLKVETEKIEDLKLVETPSMKTIDDVCKFLNTEKSKMIKAVVYTRQDDYKPVVVYIRADRDVNETKLTNLIKADVEPRKEKDTDNIVYGFVGPYNFEGNDATIVIDKSLENEASLITGANILDKHYTGLNMKRDVKNAVYVDVAKVVEKDICPVCGKSSIRISNGIEVGNIFQLGTKYTKAMGMTYLDESSTPNNPIMGCYGIGVGRLIASVLEAKATNKAVNWPITIAPFDVHICPIDYSKNGEIYTKANDLYKVLKAKGLDVLLDDRNKQPGAKFADADLVGAPIRLVISPRNLESELLEVKVTGNDKAELIKESEVIDFIENARKKLLKECGC
ncbi:MAG: proline--tRNA ligase [Clostridia bacterium]